MQFTPKSEEEVKKSNLLEPGDYDFEIINAEDKKSKSGNDMIELRLRIWVGDKVVAYIFDYLLEKIEYKLRHAAVACGLESQYNSGTLQADMFLNKAGRCTIGIQEDKTGKYSDKNVIRDYCTDIQVVPKIPDSGSITEDEDIPF